MSITNREVQTRIDIMEKLGFSFNYERYVHLCKQEEVEPYSEDGFIQRMAWFQRAKEKYPNLLYTEAYLLYLDERNSEAKRNGCGGCNKVKDIINKIKNCSGCKRRRNKIKKFIWRWLNRGGF